MSREYVPAIHYGRQEVIWDRAVIRAKDFADACEKFSRILYGINARYTVYEKTPEGVREPHADE